MKLNELKLQFIIDNTVGSKTYTLQEVFDRGIGEIEILEDMESCDCFLSESNTQCEGDCVKYENSEVTGVIII